MDRATTIAFYKAKYLLMYNVTSWCAWAYVTYMVAMSGTKEYAGNYKLIGDYLLLVQSCAILEVFHAMFGLVRSPVATTAMQVSSRLIMVWLVCDAFPMVTSSWAYTGMVVAWGITEIVRYAYYSMNLIGVDNDYYWFVTFCRYHFFYALYPLGAYSEYKLIQAALEVAKTNPDQAGYATMFRAFTWIWPPAFYIMYTHMQKQRSKFIMSGALDAKEARESGAVAEKKRN
ncbi:tyrosine phosphatase-like protein [Chytriomyces cf. hyalinus JEL632]|nr:tyrosine phosphatase-like protein [Chytriomyces cf. hyalinus JEL632]